MKKICVISLATILSLPAFAMEQTDNPEIKFPHGIELGVGLSGTTGLNGFVGYNNKKLDSFWWKRLGVRFDFATTSPIKSKLNSAINDVVGDSDDAVEVDDSLKVQDIELESKHYGLLVDFYPFGDTWLLGGWRLSGGYMFGELQAGTKLHGDKIGNDIEFELNGHKYKYTGNEMNGSASFDWRFKGPYVGTGFDFGLFCGFKIYLDAGVVFADKGAQVDLDVPLTDLYDITSGGVVAGNTVLKELFDNNKNQVLSDVRHELDKYPYFPIVKMGFMYRF
ncbi:MAG: hypothetical protein MJ164_04265 [Alphaproteobacteria bacterium]|nr:hypothetical protein [Alphaproteobacteria bacterium]